MRQGPCRRCRRLHGGGDDNGDDNGDGDDNDDNDVKWVERVRLETVGKG